MATHRARRGSEQKGRPRQPEVGVRKLEEQGRRSREEGRTELRTGLRV